MGDWADDAEFRCGEEGEEIEMKCPKTHREEVMPEPTATTQEALASAELSGILHYHKPLCQECRQETPCDRFIHDLQAWRLRHQPPRLTQAQIESAMNAADQIFSIRESRWKQLVMTELGKLALPPNPTVTKAQIQEVLDNHTNSYSRKAIEELHRLCTGAGEEPKHWCSHLQHDGDAWILRWPADKTLPGSIGGRRIREELDDDWMFCPICSAPRPRPEGR